MLSLDLKIKKVFKDDPILALYKDTITKDLKDFMDV